MSEEQKNNPLHGIKLETLLTELVEHYGFEILAGQININCFKSNPSINSSLKFLRKTPWARNKVEAFYLYRYRNLPRPTDEQFELPPRERSVGLDQHTEPPAKIEPDDKEFFDDPESGYTPHESAGKPKSVSRTRAKPVSRPKPATLRPSSDTDSTSANDPWANWRSKNEDGKGE